MRARERRINKQERKRNCKIKNTVKKLKNTGSGRGKSGECDERREEMKREGKYEERRRKRCAYPTRTNTIISCALAQENNREVPAFFPVRTSALTPSILPV